MIKKSKGYFSGRISGFQGHFKVSVLKVSVTNLQGFFDLSNNFYILNKVDFGASDFEAAALLQIEVKQKMLGRSVTFEPKSVEKRFQQQSFTAAQRLV